MACMLMQEASTHVVSVGEHPSSWRDGRIQAGHKDRSREATTQTIDLFGGRDRAARVRGLSPGGTEAQLNGRCAAVAAAYD